MTSVFLHGESVGEEINVKVVLHGMQSCNIKSCP